PIEFARVSQNVVIHRGDLPLQFVIPNLRSGMPSVKHFEKVINHFHTALHRDPRTQILCAFSVIYFQPSTPFPNNLSINSRTDSPFIGIPAAFGCPPPPYRFAIWLRSISFAVRKLTALGVFMIATK